LVRGVPDARVVRRLKPGAVRLSGLMLSAYGLDPWTVFVVHLGFWLYPWPGDVGLLWCVRAELAGWEARSELAKWTFAVDGPFGPQGGLLSQPGAGIWRKRSYAKI
jgi:hypothetical protein